MEPYRACMSGGGGRALADRETFDLEPVRGPW